MLRTILMFCLMAAPVSAEPIALDELSSYINGLKTAQARFNQYNGDGSRSDGTLYMRRPGRMRFEYDPPNEALVLANGGVVAIFDARSNSEPQQFPLKKTPLNLILGRNVDLSDARMVTGHYQADNGMTVVVAADPANAAAGQIELFFTDNPVALRQWVITDETGGRTGVVLGPLETGVSFSNLFFSVNHEAQKRSE